MILGQIMAVSTLPAHYVGVFTDNPASADALRAAEASLTARAEARQATFGRAWEQVVRLMIAVRDGRDPNLIRRRSGPMGRCRNTIHRPGGRRRVKLYTAGLLPASYALGKLGYSDDEIEKINAARRAESAPTQQIPSTPQGGIQNAA